VSRGAAGARTIILDVEHEPSAALSNAHLDASLAVLRDGVKHGVLDERQK
jgi:hypothetical protein